MTPRRLLLGLTAATLVAGAVTWLAGARDAADVVWAVGPAVLLVPLTWSTLTALVARRPDIDVIALLAMGGALVAGEQLAGAIIAVMLTGGEALEDAAGRRAERELSALLAIAPRIAHRTVDGRIEDVDVGLVAPRDHLLVRTGEVVPVDGVLQAQAVLDESTLTGESRPVTRQPGDRVASGVTNVGAAAPLVAAATAEDSTYAGIVRLVERARTEKAPFVRLADRYAAWFVPLVLAVAGGAWAISGDHVRALAVLVVATPCPLLLAAPIAMVSGIARAAGIGVIVKHGGALEALAGVRAVCFDKTGTLTTGRPTVADVVPLGDADDGCLPADDVLHLAATVEQLSPHPFAPALVAAARDAGRALAIPQAVEEIAGEGVTGTVDGRVVTVGSHHLAAAGRPPSADEQVELERAAADGASVAFVAVDGRVLAAIHFADPLRAEAAATLARLRALGIARTVMVTGDRRSVAEAVAGQVGVTEVAAEQTPAGKVATIAAVDADSPAAMVGDGVNDAPSLASAHVGIAMGARGATASSEAADVVITVDRLDRVADVIAIARRTRSVAQQSALVGMGLSVVAMGLAAGGLLTPVLGALLQEGIDVAAIANALRARSAGGQAREWIDTA